ncbi:hypothetical protein HELRODRAFT_171521 [Helobdella robusta]|uniref:Uncharacterized protein n=1 Tax=Helobdella robusta TaxID=6412 RepID=T1F4D3_HELRO|nr:hypothetical protein HELRODRAFT_171521 [Helobdella robusta]ESO05182.1 hypothetical protein HELRODRAFT_171521 [Helobdella robusta]
MHSLWNIWFTLIILSLSGADNYESRTQFKTLTDDWYTVVVLVEPSRLNVRVIRSKRSAFQGPDYRIVTKWETPDDPFDVFISRNRSKLVFDTLFERSKQNIPEVVWEFTRMYFFITSTNLLHLKTFGILKMEKESFQIAFVPENDVLEDLFPVTLNQIRSPLYAHSYINFSPYALEDQLLDIVVGPNRKSKLALDYPCSNAGTKLVGSADVEFCLQLISSLFHKTSYDECFDKPCRLDKVYQPSVPNKQRLSAFSENHAPSFNISGYATEAFYALGIFNRVFEFLDMNPSRSNLSQMLNKMVQYCKKTSLPLELNYKYGNRNGCFFGLYIYKLLQEGFGLNDENIILFGNGIGFWVGLFTMKNEYKAVVLIL